MAEGGSARDPCDANGARDATPMESALRNAVGKGSTPTNQRQAGRTPKDAPRLYDRETGRLT